MKQHPFFQNFPITQLSQNNFDEALTKSTDEIVAIFFWGHNCPNCEVAKNIMSQEIDAIKSVGFTWYHVNVYEETDLGTRFGLHGIPTFLFFHKQKKLGRISPFPSFSAFFEALQKLKKAHS